MKPKVSVIIPVYNVENYIRDCVESVVNQTLDNIEIIIVNDGCTDHSINRIDDLIKSNNLLIVNQENKGLSAARNIGLSYATGDYIAFIDSDDYIESNFIEMLYVNAVENNLDIAIGGYRKLFSNGEFLPDKRNQELIGSEVMTGEEYLYKSVVLNDYQMEVWDDLYKRSFLEENDLKFCEGIIHEDEEFTPKCILKAKRIKVIDCLGYIYRQREGSIMHQSRGLKQINSFLIIIENLVNIFKNEVNDSGKMPLSRLITRLVFIYEEKVRNSDFDNKEELLLNLTCMRIRKVMNYQRGLNLKLNIRYFILENTPSIYFIFNKFTSKLTNK
ncbi:glycosyltransferase [Turicibacter bilis]|uniref:glycosyltransferase n=1 Tax=Turicibacter bilis TaxID=2735723 RepID=UPI0031B9E717